MNAPTSDIAFTPTVKALQTEYGSRDNYAKMGARGGFRTGVTDDLIDFLADINTAYLATVSSDGQPYAQHRGGPKGFIRALDANTLAFADYRGNRQYISSGNLIDNPRAFLFLMDYWNKRRVKVWGTARMVPATADLLAALMPADYRAQPEQVLLFTVHSWDINCPQHIPQMVGASEATAIIDSLKARISVLEAEISKYIPSQTMARNGDPE